MSRAIKEADWKVFRRLRALALERFCKRVLEEVHSATTEGSADYQERYLKVHAMVKREDKTLGIAFNDPRRSVALIQLLNITALDLLTAEELEQFSPEVLDVFDEIERFRRDNQE